MVEEEKVPMRSLTDKYNDDLGPSQLRQELEQVKQSQARGYTPGGPSGMVIKSGRDENQYMSPRNRSHSAAQATNLNQKRREKMA